MSQEYLFVAALKGEICRKERLVAQIGVTRYCGVFQAFNSNNRPGSNKRPGWNFFPKINKRPDPNKPVQGGFFLKINKRPGTIIRNPRVFC